MNWARKKKGTLLKRLVFRTNSSHTSLKHAYTHAAIPLREIIFITSSVPSLKSYALVRVSVKDIPLLFNTTKNKFI